MPTLLKRNTKAILFLWLLVLGFFVYRSAIHSEFIFDDNVRITGMTGVNTADGKMLRSVLPVYAEGLSSVLKNILPDRPLLMLTIWLNYLVSGSDASSYKVTNIILHILVAFSLFLFLEKFSLSTKRPFHPFLASILATIFLVHPIHSQAVTVVIQRGAILSCLFGLWAFNCFLDYLQSGKRQSLLLLFFLYFLGLLCKSNIIILPLLLLLFANFIGIKKPKMAWLLPLLCISLVPAIFYFLLRDNMQQGTSNFSSWLNYGMVQTKVIFYYFRLVLYPVGINKNYPIAATASFLADKIWAYLAVHLFILFLGFHFFRKKKSIGLAILCFYATLIPESSVFPIDHVIFDHRIYFPFIFLSLFFYESVASIVVRKSEFHFAQVLLAICVLPLAYLDSARVNEVSSFEKWLSSSAMKYKTERSCNLNYLRYLLGKNDFQNGAIAAKEFLKMDNLDNEYFIFSRIFADVENGVDVAYQILLDPKYSEMDLTTRSVLLTYVLKDFSQRKPFDHDPDFYYLEAPFLLLNSQLPYLDASDLLVGNLDRYRYYVQDLHKKYLRMSRVGYLQMYQKEIWFLVMYELTKAFGQDELYRWHLREGVSDLDWWEFLSFETSARRHHENGESWK